MVRCLLIGCAMWLCVATLPTTSAVITNASDVSSLQVYSVTGLVKQVKVEDKTAVIQHDAVPGYMPAMTMPFKVKGPENLDLLKVGEQVRFQLSVTETESWIDHVMRIGTESESPAPAIAKEAAPAQKPRHPLMDATFTNELNQPARLADFKGQALAITFFFTRCPIPDYCPRLSKNFEEASRKLGAMHSVPTNWHFLSVSFDGANDTPAVLKAYGERYNANPRRWSFWTGPPDQVAELARQSDVTYKQGPGGFFDHNFRTLIIDPSGKLQMAFPVGGDLSEAIVSEILKALSITNRPS
jgi:protein SCO1/2